MIGMIANKKWRGWYQIGSLYCLLHLSISFYLKGKKIRTFLLIKIWFNYYIQIILPPNEEESKKPTTFTVKIKNGIELNLQVLKNYVTSGTESEDEDVNIQTCMEHLILS